MGCETLERCSLHDDLLQLSRLVGCHLSIPARPGALSSTAHTGGILEEKALWIDREFHASDAASVSSCYDAQAVPEAFGLYRYREARSFGVDLDQNLHYVDHLLLSTFVLLRSLLGERDEGVMRSFAKRVRSCSKRVKVSWWEALLGP